MPVIRQWEINALIHEALRYGNMKTFVDWVNYQRQTFPNEPSNFMLAEEGHHGARLPFDLGDHWEYSGYGWTIIKKTGQRIVTSAPKQFGEFV